MIEKLEKHIIGENAPGTVSLMVAPTAEQQVDKINELVDAVNKLDALLDLTNTAIQTVKKTEPADPYAEQRKWIGSLVEYKLGDLSLYGILTDIKDGYNPPFVIDGTSYTDDCWLPDESVIYHTTKGGNNE